MLDRALVLWFPGPGSYSGEDSAELHLHGGRGVLDGVAAVLVKLGARPAEAGEFTRRAFINGRMDLIEAEAVGDLVAAESSAQVAQALRQMEGELGAIYRVWSDRLLRLLAGAEALIDFPDEDLPPEVEEANRREIAALADAIAGHLGDGHRGERLREGLVCAIVGPPNAGKSTLMNALAGREVAIVSDIAGTTRDVLETRVVIAGVPVTLLDTAGLRASADPIEIEGVRRARARATAADMVIVIRDATEPGEVLQLDENGVTLKVANKIDLAGSPLECEIGISARNGAGVGQLNAVMAATVQRLTQSGGPPPLTRARHRSSLEIAVSELRRAILAPLPELQAENLRAALRSIGRVTGAVGVEDVLSSIFTQFCIGK